jgi:hypothetical protein
LLVPNGRCSVDNQACGYSASPAQAPCCRPVTFCFWYAISMPRAPVSEATCEMGRLLRLDEAGCIAVILAAVPGCHVARDRRTTPVGEWSNRGLWRSTLPELNSEGLMSVRILPPRFENSSTLTIRPVTPPIARRGVMHRQNMSLPFCGPFTRSFMLRFRCNLG